LLCPNAIVFISQMPKENIEISKILIKEKKIELFSKVKDETQSCLAKGRKKPNNYKSKGKRCYRL